MFQQGLKRGCGQPDGALFALCQDLQVCTRQTLPVNDPLHKSRAWQELKNVNGSGKFSVVFGFDFAALSEAQLPSLLLQLGTMPESRSHILTKLLERRFAFTLFQMYTLPCSVCLGSDKNQE